MGSLQLLTRQAPTTVGYDYVWMTYEQVLLSILFLVCQGNFQAIDYRDKDFVPVHLSYTCPAIVPVAAKLYLGN